MVDVEYEDVVKDVGKGAEMSWKTTCFAVF